MIAALDWSSPLTILGALGALALGAGTVAAYLRAGLAKATIELQKSEIEALQKSQVRMQDEMIQTKERLLIIENENKFLRELATSTKVAERLEEVIDKVQAERREEHKDMKAYLKGRKARGSG